MIGRLKRHSPVVVAHDVQQVHHRSVQLSLQMPKHAPHKRTLMFLNHLQSAIESMHALETTTTKCQQKQTNKLRGSLVEVGDRALMATHNRSSRFHSSSVKSGLTSDSFPVFNAHFRACQSRMSLDHQKVGTRPLLRATAASPA